MGRHPRADRRRSGGVQRLYTRGGEDVSTVLPRHRRGDRLRRRARRRAAGAPRGGGGAVQRSAAAAQPQDRDAQDAEGASGASSGSTTLLWLEGEDLRARRFDERRARLEAWMAERPRQRFDLSPLVPFHRLGAARPSSREQMRQDGIEGLMLKRARQPLCRRPAQGTVVQVEARSDAGRLRADVRPARPRQAQRPSTRTSPSAAGARRTEARAGAGRQGLFRLHRRGAALARQMGARPHDQPLRPGAARSATAWCWRSPSTPSQRSTRHKSGVAMRFPRINRIRCDKPAAEADSVDNLLALIGVEKAAD